PTWVERYDWKTPIAPVTIEIAIIPPASSDSSLMFWLGSAVSRMPRSRNGETMPSPAETTISAQTTASFRRYSRNSRAMRRRFARRTAGSAGRSIFSWGVTAPRNPGIATTVAAGLCGALRARGALELLPEQDVRLLAVRPPRDPALRVDDVEGREVAELVGLRDRAGRAVCGEGHRRLLRVRVEHRRERQAEVDVVREDARRVLVVAVDRDVGVLRARLQGLRDRREVRRLG